jgi:phosphoglycolate phosphatase-like HAD superfamily hydrolase
MALDRSRVRALCFDVDGTLCDTDDYYVARVSAWFRKLAFLHEPDRTARRLVMWLENPGTFLLGLADRLTLDDELIGVVNWLYRNSRNHGHHLDPVDGVIEMLDQLRRRFPMAIVSARDERTTDAFLQNAGLQSHFKAVITALSAPRTKPFPDPILLAAKELGVPPSACLMIGDTTVDVRSGRAAGAQTVGVLCGFGEREELLRHGADLILESTADLSAVLGDG